MTACRRAALAVALASPLVACTTTKLLPPEGPSDAVVTVVKRGWHTDVCLRREDGGAWLGVLARDYAGARFLCLGFGERQFVVARHHDLLTMVSALLPSEGALLLTALNAPPADAFDPTQVVSLRISRIGLAGLQAFLRNSTQTDAAGEPVRLGDGPYAGSTFFGATETYDGFYTCNTWTADALRSARVPVGGVLFSGDVMDEVRRIAATQTAGP
jgi:hypothetical protein